MKSVAVIIGSLRAASINRRLAEAIGAVAEGNLAFSYPVIADLPLYNDDLWQAPPAPVTRFKAEVAAADAVLLVTPEYNRSITPAMKNAIDWGSRPFGKSVWKDKPAAIIGTSPGAIGTAAAQFELRSIALAVGMLVMGQPDMYLTFKEDKFDGNTATDPDLLKFLTGWATSFAGFLDRHA